MNIPISDHMAPMSPSLIREIFKAAQKEGLISFTAGGPSPDVFPIAELSAAAERVFSRSAVTALSYGITEGYQPLRDWVTARLKAEHLCGEDDDVLILSGGQQALDITAKCLINDGDTVIVEAPTFLNALNTFCTYGAQLAGVPVDAEGMDTDALEQVLKRERSVKLIYTIPNFQNPTGVTLSAARRRRLYDLAAQYDVCILEDDPYGKLRYSGTAVDAVKSLDTQGRVIYTSSFSKVIAPGIRAAYLSAPKALTAKMVVAKQCIDVHTNMISQLILTEYLTHCDLDAHIAHCCAHYRVKRDAMLSAIARHFPASVAVTHPEGGLFLWVTLPAGVSAMAVHEAAVANGVAAVPGAPFFPYPDDSSFRLNFSVPSLAQIEDGIERLGAVLHKAVDR